LDAIRTMMRKLFADKRGATAIEYGLIAALIGVAIITSLNALGGKSGGMWDKLNNAVSRV
jgi:pilus assembly protein Flp/PilA